MSNMYCRNCGSVIGGNSTLCNNCGQDPSEGANYCPECGHFCIPGDTMCIQCHTSLARQSRISKNIGGMQAQPQPASSSSQAQQPSSNYKYLADNKKYCRNCGLVIDSGAHQCEFCGSASGTNYCQHCGSSTMPGDTVCRVCSSPLQVFQNAGYVASPPPVAMRSGNASAPGAAGYAPQQPGMPPSAYPSAGPQSNFEDTRCDFVITLLLNVLFGYLGAHRFYTRNIGIGLLQLITGGGCGIWWLIDLIMICTGSYRDGDGNELKR